MIGRIKKIYDTEDLKQKVKDLEGMVDDLVEENQKLRSWIESRGGVVE